MSAERSLNPSEYTDEQLDRFLFALEGRFKTHFHNGVEIPMTREEIAEYLKVSPRQVDKLIDAKVLTPRRLTSGGYPRFFASEIKWH